jgi:C4-type Zn-finger protein
MRDTAGKRFDEPTLEGFLEEAVDRVRTYSVFESMPYADDVLEVSYLPLKYHYLLAVYASSRLFELDNDYYQAVQRMNEFEHKFSELIDLIESGEVVIKDALGNAVINTSKATDTVSDVYFKTTGTDTESISDLG